MRRLRSLFLALIAILGVGCASAPTPVTQVSRSVGEQPAIGETVERYVGEVLYETYNFSERELAELDGPLTIDVFAAKAYLGPADRLAVALEAGAKVFCTEEPKLRVMGLSPESRVCLRDTDGDGRFDQWRAPEGPPARQVWASVDVPIGFGVRGAMRRSEGGFKYQLLYQGYAAGVISLLYREYIDDLIRPAFQQDLTYTLKDGEATEISFRSLRFRVESADNNTIRYVLLRGLGVS
ncbi:MAG: hypothetical protein AAGE94_00560 [Acidobacteriota bacterium]